MPELRRVKNVGDLPFADSYDGQQFLIEPGHESLVPLEAVSLWFGDNAQRNDIHRRFRDEEVTRLHVRYGAYHDAELWDAAAPRVEVSTPEGDVVETVLSDPQGTKVTAANTTISEQSQLVEMINKQGEDLDRLREQYRQMARANEALTAGSDIEDQPQVPASRAARNRGATQPVGIVEDTPARVE